ncbi:hypothetical protein [Streptomyces sp. NPDC050416]|uniref:hypothetical protein n=1 Tax=Streptomyces sp. NPDC050416 TaxID=3365611 RepID=UPI00379D3A8B
MGEERVDRQGGHAQHRFAPQVLGENGSGGAVSSRQAVASWSGDASAKSRQPRSTSGALDREHRQACEDGGTEPMQPEFQLGDDAEVPSVAADAPEQVGVVGLARAHRPAVGEHDLAGQ